MRFRRKRTPAEAAPPVDIDAFARAVDPRRPDEAQFVRLVDVLDMLGRVGTGIELARMRTDPFVWFASRTCGTWCSARSFAGRATTSTRSAPPTRTRWSTGACTSGRQPTADAPVTPTLPPVDSLHAVTGTAKEPLPLLRGRGGVHGDLAFAAGLTGYAGLPKLWRSGPAPAAGRPVTSTQRWEGGPSTWRPALPGRAQ